MYVYNAPNGNWHVYDRRGFLRMFQSLKTNFFKSRFKPIKDLVTAGGTCTQEDIAALMLKMALEGQDFNKRCTISNLSEMQKSFKFSGLELV